jgi:4-hydroxy-tetrahydrodipicolinate synthase
VNPYSPSRPQAVRGVCPVLATPFDVRGDPDVGSLVRVVEFAIASGADAVVYPGVASEVEQLNDDERDRLVDAVANAARGRVPFVMGASASDPAATLRHLRKAADVGAVAAMVMAPARLAGDVPALVDYYRELGRDAAVPVMLQNAPPPAGAGFDMAAIARVVVEVSAVRYVKEEAMPCGQRISALLARPELASAPRFDGVLGGAGGRYLLD